MTKPEYEWATRGASLLSTVSNWDPLGIAVDEAPPAVVTRPEDDRPMTVMDPLPPHRPARAGPEPAGRVRGESTADST